MNFFFTEINKTIRLAIILFSLTLSSKAQTNLVSSGDVWNYFDNGEIGSSAWKNLNYDDSGWQSGNSELGYGDGDEETIIGFGSSLTHKNITSYFRKEVQIPGNIINLNASVKIDDGCVVYFNGIEVFRDNLPSGEILFSTLSLTSENENTWKTFSIPINLILSNQPNLISVEMHQNSISSTDLSLDFTLNYLQFTPGGIFIYEFMASNSMVEVYAGNSSYDWIEIKNTQEFPVDISGYFITDNFNTPTKVKLPNSPGLLTIPPNGFLTLICSDNTSLGPNHIVLGLSAQGESIAIFAPDGVTLVDSIRFQRQIENISYGRDRNNIENWKFFKTPSPNSENSLIDFYDSIISPPSFSHSGGIYQSSFELGISSNDPNTIIYYTLDGSDPDPLNINGKTYEYKNELFGGMLNDQINTYIYSSSITIEDRSNFPNKISNKSSSFIRNSNNFYFPNQPVSKGTVVKAIAYKPNALSEVGVNSYFIFENNNKYSLPITSISLDEDKLFDYFKGFYTPGVLCASTDECATGNYSLSTRYSGFFEFFDQGEIKVHRPVELAINGGCTRAFPRKTLRIYGGTDFNYPFFSDYPNRNHRNILLRNSGNNWDIQLFKDVANQKIMDGLNFGKQESRPSIVFLNGEYWGIHNIRERIDEHYLNELFNVPKDSLDLIEISFGASANEGDLSVYQSMINFITYNDLSNNIAFDSVKNFLDIDNFIDYQISNIFVSNRDWPSNNVRLWRKKVKVFNQAFVGPSDGRFRFILYDTDLTLENFSDINIAGLINSNSEYTLLFRKLLENQIFKNNFLSRFADILNTNFIPDRTVSIINNFKSIYDPEIIEHGNRWNTPNLSEWNGGVQSMVDFYNYRPQAEREQLIQYFGLEDQRTIQINVSSSSEGYIKINTINILPSTPGVPEQPYPWMGIYFKTIPVKIVAIPKKGFKFKHWLLNDNIFSTSASITVTLDNNKSFTAIFEEYVLSSNPFPIAKTLNACGYRFSEWQSSSPSGVFPSNMAFYYLLPINTNQSETELTDTLGGVTYGFYNLTKSTRINGLGSQGISLVNTGGGNTGYPAGKLGGIVLAISTLNQDSVFISWVGGTIAPNVKSYGIRLQYRVGDLSDFKDIFDENGSPIEYKRNIVAGHQFQYENIKLPSETQNKPYVQLLWRYYFYGNEASGARAELRIDDIIVTTKKQFDNNITQSSNQYSFGKIISGAKIENNSSVFYEASKSIELAPGFSTLGNSIFNAKIVENCPN